MRPQIAGILLAAGESRRLNSPKQLLYFQGEYLINHAIKTIRMGGISDLYVVLGANFRQIKSKITDGKIEVVKNRNWRMGIHTSISAGITRANKLPGFDGAIIFVVDQPFLNPSFIKAQISDFCLSNKLIVAPRFNKNQINPVLFSKELFPKLENLQYGQSGKTLIQHEEVHWIEIEDELMTMDIDTNEEYSRVIFYSSSVSSASK